MTRDRLARVARAAVVGVSLGLGLALWAWVSGSTAYAGAGCVGATSPVPTRLGPCERFLAGIAVQAEAGALRWDTRGQVRASSLTEAGVETTFALGAGLSRRTQLGATLPVRYTWRATPSLASGGGGIGDARLVGRYNLLVEGTRAGAERSRPGVWLTAGARLPTGRAWPQAADPLLSDVTGLEHPAATVGVIAERTQHRIPWVAVLSAEVDHTSVVATAQAGVGRTFGPRWTLLGAVGHTVTLVDSGSDLAVTDRTWLAGRLVVGRMVRWRAWLGAASDLPLPVLGRDQPLLTRITAGGLLVR